MREIIAKDGQDLDIGKRGEHLAQRVTFDISAWEKAYGEGEVHLLHQRNGDKIPYPCVVEVDKGRAYWAVTNTDVAIAGRGHAELQYWVGETIAKSVTYNTMVARSMGAAGDVPPAPAEYWLNTMLELGVETKENAEAAEESAISAAASAAEAAESAASAAESVAEIKEVIEGAISNALDSIEQSVAEAGACAEAAAQCVEEAATHSGAAQTSAENAAASATAAENAAQTAAEKAEEAVAGEMTGYITSAQNAEKGALAAQSAAETAKAGAEKAQAAAEKAKEDAQKIAGGDFVSRGGDTMTGTLKMQPEDADGYATIYKNANATGDYGLQMIDADADGNFMGLTLSANLQKLELKKKRADEDEYHFPKLYDTDNPPTAYEVGALPIEGGTLQGSVQVSDDYARVKLAATASHHTELMKNADSANDYGTILRDTNGEDVAELKLSATNGNVKLAKDGKEYVLYHEGNLPDIGGGTADEITVTDETAALFGLGEDATVDEALNKLTEAAFVKATPKYAEVSLGGVAEGSIIKLNENGKAVEFYVAKHKYNTNRTLLVRKNIYNNQQWDSGGFANYNSSTIDTWLNETYKALLDEDVQSKMATTDIKYTYYDSVEESFNLGSTYRSVFLLSASELGFTDSYLNSSEGTALPIASTLKIATTSAGATTTQWTRSQVLNATYQAWDVKNSGTTGKDQKTNSYGIRPAFTLPATYGTFAVDSTGAIQDEQEYERSITDLSGNPVGTRIETGSYVGTGTYGSANPNTLTFGFEPKFVYISVASKSSYSVTPFPLVFNMNCLTESFSAFGYATIYENSFTRRCAKKNGTTLSWYDNSSSAPHQGNISGATYHYIAIG